MDTLNIVLIAMGGAACFYGGMLLPDRIGLGILFMVMGFLLLWLGQTA